jgi:hypothetical protein|tara:strand:- start:269 stop:859 length:591 start_codon:yes stop_codon:yes gene_type:complete
MLSSSENVFPTEIKIFQFNIPEMQPLIDEVLSKKKEIKKISDVFSNHGNVNKDFEYITDFRNPIKIFEFEKLMMQVVNFFGTQNKIFSITNYWTAFYGKNVLHDTHLHGNFNDTKRLRNNFSSVFYLTENGGTNFYSPNLTSTVSEVLVKSEVGKFVVFPHNLFHNGNNRQEMLGQGGQTRIIMSANIEVFDYETQ